MMTKEQLTRNINVMKNGEIDFLLGAGASVNSGISSGGDLVWFFKRLIYCDDNNISPEKYKDLYLSSTREMLQNYFDKKVDIRQYMMLLSILTIFKSVFRYH